MIRPAAASSVLMLRHIEEEAAAGRIMAALKQVLGAGDVRTRDLGGNASTAEFADAVCEQMA